ncbi:MAG: zinc-ribbon domain-containing protein [Saccharofermentanales bacterium]
MPDKMLNCKDCGAEFAFTEGEQQFYKEKGFENEPVRCPVCRKARKNQRQSQGSYDSRY